MPDTFISSWTQSNQTGLNGSRGRTFESVLVGVIGVTLESNLHDLVILGDPLADEALEVMEVFVVQVEVGQMLVCDEGEKVVVIRWLVLQISRVLFGILVEDCQMFSQGFCCFEFGDVNERIRIRHPFVHTFGAEINGHGARVQDLPQALADVLRADAVFQDEDKLVLPHHFIQVLWVVEKLRRSWL